MTITVSDILIAPAKIFEVDGVDLGATAGGIEMHQQDTWTEVEADQYPDAIVAGLSKRIRTVHTQLLQAQLTNWQVAWGLTAGPALDGSNNNVLYVGLERLGKFHSVYFTGISPDGVHERQVTIHKAAITTQNAFTISKDKPHTFDLTFSIYPDTSQPAGEEFIKISDSASALY